ncbi:hypothetical protein MUNTM_22420 [Mycobacterium sp. MUNTM1]
MSWVGGDIAGLIALGHTLETVPSQMKDIANALDSSVDTLANDASWSGHGAEAFRKAWTLSSVRIAGIESSYEAFGGVVTELGHQLQALENDLYNAATQAKSEGAQIGENGQPLPLVITGDPNAPDAQRAVKAQNDYNQLYAQILQTAQGFRIAAAGKIQKVSGDLEPPENGKEPAWDKATTIADYLKGLYVIPNARNDHLAQVAPGKIDELRQRLRDARKDLKAARDAYAAKGLSLPKGDWARTNHLSAVNDVKLQEAALDGALKGEGEWPFSKILNSNIGDLGKLAYPASELARLPKGLEFLKDIPVVDLAAAGLIGHLQTVADVEKGWSPNKARVSDYGPQLAGIAAGTAAAGAIIAAPVELPVAAALAVGGALAWGVGDFGNSITHEHWAEDIHDRGVMSGLLHGTGHVFSQTGNALVHDVTDVGGAIGDGAKGLWHSVFG